MMSSPLPLPKPRVLIPWVLLTLILVLTRASFAQSPKARENMERQISELRKEKLSRTPAQKKLDSQLIYLVKERRGNSITKAAPHHKAAVAVQPGDLVEVDITAKVTAELTSAITTNGGVIVSEVPAFDAIRAKIPVDKLETISGREDVKSIKPAAYRETNAGSVTSQGDATHRAPFARSNYRVAGAGVKVGVLSDSVEPGLATSKASGNLPANLVVLPNRAGTGLAEGTAMLEIVHDLAPSASLYFATGGPSPAQMAHNILDLAASGCHIIVDDVYFFGQPPFQDGVIAKAVSTVSTRGVLYVSCAANYGNLSSNQSGTWEGNFFNGGTDSYGTAHRFDGDSANGGSLGNYIMQVGSLYDLWWSDPLGKSGNDYDLYISDYFGNIKASSTNDQTGTQDPHEAIRDTSNILPGDYIYIYKTAGADRYLFLFSAKGVNEYATNGATHSHNASGALNALTVAATPAAESDGGSGSPKGPFPGPFTSLSKFETFSSDGPRRMFFMPDGTPFTPGNFSASGGKVLLKPDLTAADGVVTTLPKGQGLNPFFGTSAAAPHAAAIAALVKSKNPTLTATQIKSILITTAIDISTAGWDRDSGHGIIMADRALAATPSKEIALSGNLTFGPVSVGTSKSAILKIRNLGNIHRAFFQ